MKVVATFLLVVLASIASPEVGAKKTHQSMRFFMVPGMQHDPGADGTENFDFDTLALLKSWKEHGVVPDVLIATHYKNGVALGKPLVCQYPLIAYYEGSGNTEDPASYRCRPSRAG